MLRWLALLSNGPIPMSEYSGIGSHRGMVFDTHRNNMYCAAIRRVVTPGSVVLDLGSGLGLHGLFAASLGARHVYLVDPSPVMAVAREVARSNGLNENLSFIQERIERVQLPEKVDVIISVLTGNFLLHEDLLPSLLHCRDRHLKASGVMIPDQASMLAVPVTAGGFFKENVDIWSQSPHGIDYHCVRQIAANSVYFPHNEIGAECFLSEPVAAAHMDFTSATGASCASQVRFDITRADTCHGILGWFDMRLDGECLSTSPAAPPTHWSQMFFPLDPAISVHPGDSLELRLDRPAFGDWSWLLSHGKQSQKHSTFLARKISPQALRSQLPDHKPGLGIAGRLQRDVLTLLARGYSNAEVLRSVEPEYTDYFSSRDELAREIKRIVQEFGE